MSPIPPPTLEYIQRKMLLLLSTMMNGPRKNLLSNSLGKGETMQSRTGGEASLLVLFFGVFLFFGVPTPHVLLHLVKSSCPNSVNPFSTLFSADIQHNCPIFFVYVDLTFHPD